MTAAAFTIEGEGAATYSVTLPSSVSLAGNGTAMTVATFTSTPGDGALSGNAGAVGTQTLLVGGTLAVGASQAAGSYSGDFDVTVAYN